MAYGILKKLEDLTEYYEKLSLPENASLEEIKIAYRLLAKKYHPDKQAPESSLAEQKIVEERFKAIQKAYEILTSSK